MSRSAISQKTFDGENYDGWVVLMGITYNALFSDWPDHIKALKKVNRGLSLQKYAVVLRSKLRKTFKGADVEIFTEFDKAKEEIDTETHVIPSVDWNPKNREAELELVYKLILDTQDIMFEEYRSWLIGT